ncbi:hypothetical protein JRO89_XS11G0209900 [Xanthoceras sorbifolium]|uniref:Uncharacterized protein n=1 Tax=Xanthoceras sorbifolium TaxID=99658 RepID=A0ABQ8HGJ6_9ROSI|nr:hypothetical protein JRO89_XS11G0209900 [Xanthoceras sorbifolium]
MGTPGCSHQVSHDGLSYAIPLFHQRKHQLLLGHLLVAPMPTDHAPDCLGLQESLRKFTKETKSISEYMMTMKSMVDDLALIGHPLSDDDIVVHVLTGLGPEYKELNAAIRARDTPISFEELYDKLADHEIFLKREESKKESSHFTAQFNQHFNSNKPKGNSNNRRGQNQNFNNSTNNW